MFSRSVKGLEYLTSQTLDVKKTDHFPKKILYPTDFFPHSNPDQQEMVEQFISRVEKFLGVRRTIFSMKDRWDKCPPEAAKGKTLKEYLAKVSSNPRWSFWRLTKYLECILANVL